ncbi:hypothetical protein ABZP36_005532 [Zizania latifolia]
MGTGRVARENADCGWVGDVDGPAARGRGQWRGRRNRAVVHRQEWAVGGAIPDSLATMPIVGETVGEVRPVSDMHQRKAEMARQSDAFITLPGGYGTLEELLEVISWAQLGIHRKPVGLLNVDGYYNSLLTFIDQAVEEGFVSLVLAASSCRLYRHTNSWRSSRYNNKDNTIYMINWSI